jgi:hypothetical protein
MLNLLSREHFHPGVSLSLSFLFPSRWKWYKKESYLLLRCPHGRHKISHAIKAATTAAAAVTVAVAAAAAVAAEKGLPDLFLRLSSFASLSQVTTALVFLTNASFIKAEDDADKTNLSLQRREADAGQARFVIDTGDVTYNLLPLVFIAKAVAVAGETH